MAIRAIQLNGAVGAFQIVAQMNCMVQLDCSGIGAAWTHGSELRVPAVEAGNVVREVWRESIAAQIRMALRAVGICSGRETEMATMLLMTRRTIRLEGLIGVVNRAVVT